jgi:hypothetical protein
MPRRIRLNEAQVRRIKIGLRAGCVQVDLAREYGVSIHVLSRINKELKQEVKDEAKAKTDLLRKLAWENY